MSYVEYNSNNSGGGWWLNDDDWKALEAAGWIVVWSWQSEKFNADGGYVRGEDGIPLIVPYHESGSKFHTEVREPGYRWLGALAKTAYRPGASLREAADEWERVTGKSALEAGCPCCGQPHRFSEYDETGRHLKSGPETTYEATW